MLFVPSNRKPLVDPRGTDVLMKSTRFGKIDGPNRALECTRTTSSDQGITRRKISLFVNPVYRANYRNCRIREEDHAQSCFAVSFSRAFVRTFSFTEARSDALRALRLLKKDDAFASKDSTLEINDIRLKTGDLKNKRSKRGNEVVTLRKIN